MSARTPRFEVVRGRGLDLVYDEQADPPFSTREPLQFHARFAAANGRIVWWTEAYRRRVDAIRAIELFTGNPVKRAPNHAGGGLEVFHETLGLLEVREVSA